MPAPMTVSGESSGVRSPGGAAVLAWAIRYLTPSVARNAVITAIRMGAVCNAPTSVMNPASSTMVKGAAMTDPGTAASSR